MAGAARAQARPRCVPWARRQRQHHPVSGARPSRLVGKRGTRPRRGGHEQTGCAGRPRRPSSVFAPAHR
eukprot:2597229-Pyramimonas_sp.AAC.1